LYLGGVAAALYTFSGEADGLLVLCKEGVIEVYRGSHDRRAGG
jgi:hypothetical protein